LENGVKLCLLILIISQNLAFDLYIWRKYKMYALIKASGTQYKVAPGDVLELNRMQGEPGEIITLEDNVLLYQDEAGTQVGVPTIAGSAVELEILEHFRGEKLIVFKIKRRKRYRRKNGHRQDLTRVSVKEIKIG